MIKKILIGFAIIGGILFISNPTPDDFQGYIDSTEASISLWNYSEGTTKGKNFSTGRADYFLFFSIYAVKYVASYTESDGKYHVEYSSKKYIGIFKNFFELRK